MKNFYIKKKTMLKFLKIFLKGLAKQKHKSK